MKIVEGLTFDDVLLVPIVSEVLSRKQVSTATHITEKIKLEMPIVSANMDTVTEAEMAITMAKVGGVGVIHRFNTIEAQANEITKVKREQNVVIENPYYVTDEASLDELRKLSLEKGVSGFPVLNSEGKLVGIITKRDYSFEVDNTKKVKDLMTRDVITAEPGVSHESAKKLMAKNKIEKLPIINKNGKLVGMITAKDIRSLGISMDFSTKDKKGRLVVGGAIGVGGDYLERTKALIDAETDFIVVDIANGYLDKTAEVVKDIKKRFGVEIIAGNVATKEGVLHLKKAGADCIKIGIGPGGACLTRPVAGVGYPQLSAIMECAGNGTRIISDGGIVRSADLSKAMAAGADAVMIGSLLAGTDESPGSIVTKSNQNFKFYRGMASINAFSDKALRTNEEIDIESYTPEGTEMLIPYKGSASKILHNLVGGLKSAMTYLNAKDLKDFRNNASFVRLTEAGKKESKYI